MILRTVSYNIHKCIGGIDRRYQPDRIVDAIGHYEPDIVCLQEVDSKARRSNRDKQVDLLGERLGLRHRAFFPNVRVRGGGEYGNAILSRFPLTETQNIDLTIPPKKRRSVLHVRLRVRIPGRNRSRTVHVYNMHLGLAGFERKLQLKKFLASHPFANLDHRTPIIVAGDFNDVYGTLGKLLEPEGFVGVPRALRTFPAYAPVRALDAIYGRGELRFLRIFRSRLEVAKRASDHLPLIADFAID